MACSDSFYTFVHIVGPVDHEPQGPTVIVAVVVVVVSVCGALLAVLVSVGIVIGCCLRKREPHEVVYEDPDGEPSTGDNMAYGSISVEKRLYSQPPTELRGQVYEEPENFKPDPPHSGERGIWTSTVYTVTMSTLTESSICEHNVYFTICSWYCTSKCIKILCLSKLNAPITIHCAKRISFKCGYIILLC